MSGRIVYTIELTRTEYQAAMYMDDRGYLGQIVTHATSVEPSENDDTFTLEFTEPDAWKVLEACEDDPDAVWALTDMSTSLGQKFNAFLCAIV